MFDKEKFRKLSVNGIYDVGTNATAEGYQKYCNWRDILLAWLNMLERATRYSSHTRRDLKEYQTVLKYCENSPEMAVSVLTQQLTQNASWNVLALIYDLTGYKSKPENAGLFYSQIGDWLLYFDSLRCESSDDLAH